MGKHELNKREYGSRYEETQAITDLGELAEKILIDLPAAGAEIIPAGVQFSIHVLAGVLLQLHLGGLNDDFTFADRVTRRYSDQAVDLIHRLVQIIESYNWTNPNDPTDRRFVYSVYLLAESDFRSIFWVPGVVRVA